MAQWEQTAGPPGGKIMCMTKSGSNIFAGTWAAGVFRSTDDGVSWTEVNNGITSMDVSKYGLKQFNNKYYCSQ